jgi:hypothetical protein
MFTAGRGEEWPELLDSPGALLNEIDQRRGIQTNCLAS